MSKDFLGLRSFIIGFAQAFDIAGVLPQNKISLLDEPLYGEKKSDFEIVYEDWAILGRDFQQVITSHEVNGEHAI